MTDFAFPQIVGLGLTLVSPRPNVPVPGAAVRGVTPPHPEGVALTMTGPVTKVPVPGAAVRGVTPPHPVGVALTMTGPVTKVPVPGTATGGGPPPRGVTEQWPGWTQDFLEFKSMPGYGSWSGGSGTPIGGAATGSGTDVGGGGGGGDSGAPGAGQSGGASPDAGEGGGGGDDSESRAVRITHPKVNPGLGTTQCRRCGRHMGVGRDPAGLGQTWWNPAVMGPVLSSFQAGNPPAGGPTWWQYAWIYMSTGGYPIPTNPPPGVTGSGTVIGTWVETDSNHWVWFPPDNTLSQINGFWVMGNSNASGAPAPWQAFPAPTVSPDGTQGTWSEPHKGYWVWTPGAATAATVVAGLSTGEMILLAILGLGAIGGVGYLLLD
jgi:hypothetical protein